MNTEEMQKLCDEATLGPWEGLAYFIIKRISDDEIKTIGEVSYNENSTYPDSEFIAVSRSWVPWAIEELRAKDRRIEKLEAVVKAAKEFAIDYKKLCEYLGCKPRKLEFKIIKALEELEKE